MSLAEQLSSFFESHGIQYVYGVPGEGILEILDALQDGPVHFVATRQLWAAGYAAMGEAWVKGRPAVCMSGAGSYSAELARPFLDAMHNGLPILHVGLSFRFSDARNVRDSENQAFKESDIQNSRDSELQTPLTVVKANIFSTLYDMPKSLEHAFELAQGEPSGPVSIALSAGRRAGPRAERGSAAESVEARAEEEAAAESVEARAEEEAAEEARGKGQSPVDGTSEIGDDLLQRLAQSENPLIAAGSRVVWEGAGERLAEFARAHKIPVAPTLGALGVLPTDDELCLPVVGLQQGDEKLAGLDEADLVLAVGVRANEIPWTWLHGDGARPVYQIAPDHLEKLEAGLRGMRPTHDERGNLPSPLRSVSARRRSVLEMRDRFRESRGFPPNPVRVFDAVREVLDKDDLIVVDAGLSRLWAGRFLQTAMPRTIFIPPAGVSPGFGFTASLGARLAKPDGRALVLCGDASFLSACTEIETHRRLGSHVVTLVMRDSQLGWIGHLQEREFGRRSSVGFRLPNIIRLSKVLGGTGDRLEKGDRLETLLREAFAARGAVVVDCPVDTRGTKALVEAWGRPIEGM